MKFLAIGTASMNGSTDKNGGRDKQPGAFRASPDGCRAKIFAFATANCATS